MGTEVMEDTGKAISFTVKVDDKPIVMTLSVQGTNTWWRCDKQGETCMKKTESD